MASHLTVETHFLFSSLKLSIHVPHSVALAHVLQLAPHELQAFEAPSSWYPSLQAEQVAAVASVHFLHPVAQAVHVLVPKYPSIHLVHSVDDVHSSHPVPHCVQEVPDSMYPSIHFLQAVALVHSLHPVPQAVHEPELTNFPSLQLVHLEAPAAEHPLHVASQASHFLFVASDQNFSAHSVHVAKSVPVHFPQLAKQASHFPDFSWNPELQSPHFPAPKQASQFVSHALQAVPSKKVPFLHISHSVAFAPLQV